MKYICGKYCSSYYYSFLYSDFQLRCSNINHFNYSTISNCANDLNIKRIVSIWFYYGNIISNYFNGTNNIIEDHFCAPVMVSGSFSTFSYSNIFKCKSDITIGISACSTTSECLNVNIINNTNTYGNYGLIHLNSGIVILRNWIFKGNYVSLFDVFAGTMNLYDCYLDWYQYGRGAPNLGTCLTNTFTNSHQISFHLCFFNEFTLNHFEKKSILFNLFFFYNKFYFLM